MNLEQNYQRNTPWPARDEQQVLFILDVRNSTEEEILRSWIGHYGNRDNHAFDAPKVCIDLKDERVGFDSGQLVMSLALPDNTIIAPLRIVWTPAEDENGAITLGRLRYLITGDPRKPSARRARTIAEEHPERVHLIAGKPDTMANLRQRFEANNRVEDESAQEDFANFVARQAAVVLDISERQVRGGRYKVPRHVAATIMANGDYNREVQRLADEQGRSCLLYTSDAADDQGLV